MKQNNKYMIEIKNKTTKKMLKKCLDRLNIKFIKQKEKVAYYYEDINSKTIFSFNENITFYAASTIKLLVAVYLYEKKINLSENVLLTKEDIKPGSGILKENFKEPKSCSLYNLLKYTIKYSDNTAYIKLVKYIGPENLIKYGKKIHLVHPLEGKDFFGITNCHDLMILLKHIYELQKYHSDLREWLENPSYKIIDEKNLNHAKFLRKYGFFGIAFHEIGIVNTPNPYYLCVLTQKGNNKKSIKFLNKTAYQLTKIHHLLNKQ